jgi:uncharacterized protein (TIGR04255 family)
MLNSVSMGEFPHLRRAPITEAVIDFRVEPATGITVDALADAVKARGYLGYVPKGFVIRGEFGFSFKAETEQVAHEGRAIKTGVRLHSPDEKYVAQLNIDGFTLSRLEPYESWEMLIAETRRIWRSYTECLGPGLIIRIATRYVNNLRLPFTPNLEPFLRLLPNIPPRLPQVLSEFLQRYVLQDAGIQAAVIVTEALTGASPDKPLPVILDIDAFRFVKLTLEDDAVWRYLEQLRDLKNRVFFGSLTPQGMELYQ